MFLAVRHGHRIDHLPEEEKEREDYLHYDPHLSPQGKEEAIATGKHLKEFLSSDATEGLDLSQVKIITSPFIRCVETASLIAEQLNITTLTLEENICEWLGNTIYDQTPLPDLAVKTGDPEDLTRWTRGRTLQWSEKNFPTPQFPEIGCFDRLKDTFDDYQQDIRDQGGKNIIIAVGHGYFVRSLINIVTGRHDRLPYPKYCAVDEVVLDQKSGQWEIVRKMDCRHTQDSD